MKSTSFETSRCAGHIVTKIVEAEFVVCAVGDITGILLPSLFRSHGIERSMSDIDPSDVESISVLKDASATSVYGVKGGNGVILITSKRGQEGRMQITATYEQTMKTPTSKSVQEDSYHTLTDINMMYRNTNQYSKVRGPVEMEHFRTGDMPYFYPNVDAFNYDIAPFALDNRANISASGGTKNSKYFISLGLLHEGDVMKAHQTLYDASYKYDRANFRMNFDFNLTKTTLFSVSTSGFVGTQSYGGRSDMGDQGAISNLIYTTPPYISPYIYPAWLVAQYPDPNNPIISDRVAGNTFVNGNPTPDYRHNYKGSVQNVSDRIGTDVVLSQKLDVITPGLSVKVNLSYNNDSYWTGGG